MAAPKAILQPDEYEKLDDADKAKYRAVGDRFVFDLTPVDGWALEDVKSLRSALERVRNERDGLKTRADSFADVDLDEYRRLVAKKEEIDGWDPTKDEAVKTRVDEINANWQRKYDSDVKKATERADSAEGKIRTHLTRSAALAALAKHAPKHTGALLPHVEPKLGVFDGEKVYVVGEEGRPAITKVAGKMGHMEPEELVLALRENPEFAPLFPGTGSDGVGHDGGTGRARKPGQIDPNLPPEERLKRARMAEAS